MIRYLLTLILFWGFLSHSATGQSLQQKKDTLATSILINPNDLLYTITDWDITTSDGFTYRANTGLYGFNGPQPSVYLDGLPVDFSFFNWQNLNMLPVTMQQIKAVHYSSAPQIYNANLARSGFLDLRTAPPDSGFGAFGSFTLGNQIEDPGPWAYDSSKVTPNIDRRGPHYFGGLSYMDESWQARAQLSLRQHQPTNLNNNHRIGSYSFIDGTWHAVKNKIGNGLAEIKYQSKKWSLRSRLLYSDNDEYIFFQPFGREIPANTAYSQVALQGYRQAGNWRVEGRYAANSKDIGYRTNNKEYNFDWQQLKHQFSLSGRYQKSTLEFSTGAALEYAVTEGLQLNNEQTIATLYGMGKLQLDPKHALHSETSLDIAASQTAFSFSGGSRHEWTDFWDFNTKVSYDELLYYRQQSSTYWDQHGYSLYEQLDIGCNLPFSSNKNQSFIIALNNNFALSPAIDLSLDGKFIRHFALNVPWQIVSHDDKFHTGIYTRPQSLHFSSEKGSRYKLTLGLVQNINAAFNHSLTFTTQHSSTGSTRYRYYWQQTPEERLNYQVKYTPFSDLSLSLSAAYRSSTLWREYQNIDGKRYRSLQPQYKLQYGTFHIRTPSFLNVGLTAKKWFWNRRLATTFSLRNLLNTEVRYHTMGPDKALTFIIKASLKF